MSDDISKMPGSLNITAGEARRILKSTESLLVFSDWLEERGLDLLADRCRRLAQNPAYYNIQRKTKFLMLRWNVMPKRQYLKKTKGALMDLGIF